MTRALLALLLACPVLLAQEAGQPEARDLLRTGQEKEAKGDLPGARADLDRAVELDPALWQAWYQRALLRGQTGDLSGANADWDRVLGLAPKNGLAWTNRGVIRRRLGDVPGAIQDHDRALELDPDLLAARLNRGHARLLGGEGAGAREDFERALRSEPDLVAALVGRARASLLLGETGPALTDLERAAGLEPEVLQHRLDLASARWLANDLPGAEREVETALGRGRSDAALFLRARLRAKQGEVEPALADLDALLGAGDEEPAPGDLLPAERARAHDLRGTLRRRKGQLEPALLDAERAVQLTPEGSPERGRHLTHRGLARSASGDPEGARRDHDAALAADPELAEAWFNRGLLRLRQGEPGGAIGDLDEVLRREPAAATALFARGEAKIASGDRAGALLDLEAALASDPDLSAARVNRALLLVDQGRAAEAMAELDEAIRRDPQAPLAWNNRGVVKKRRGDLAGAAADLEEALRLFPSYAAAHLNLGEVRLWRGELEPALEHLDQAVRLDPGKAAAWIQRGRARAASGKGPEALADLDRALQLQETAYARTARAQVRIELGDLQPALLDLDEALAREPGSAWARSNRATTRALAGDLNGAIADLERLVQETPGDPYPALWLFGLSGQAGPLETCRGTSAPIGSVVRCALGELPREELLAAIGEPADDAARARACEAHGFLGLISEQRGEVEAARAAYASCVATGAFRQAVHAWARARLRGPEAAPWIHGAGPAPAPIEPAPPEEVPPPTGPVEPAPPELEPEVAPVASPVETAPPPEEPPAPIESQLAVVIPPEPPAPVETQVAALPAPPVLPAPPPVVPPSAPPPPPASLLPLVLFGLAVVVGLGAVILGGPRSEPGAETDESLNPGDPRPLDSPLDEAGLPQGYLHSRFRDPKALSGSFDLSPPEGTKIPALPDRRSNPEIKALIEGEWDVDDAPVQVRDSGRYLHADGKSPSERLRTAEGHEIYGPEDGALPGKISDRIPVVEEGPQRPNSSDDLLVVVDSDHDLRSMSEDDVVRAAEAAAEGILSEEQRREVTQVDMEATVDLPRAAPLMPPRVDDDDAAALTKLFDEFEDAKDLLGD